MLFYAYCIVAAAWLLMILFGADEKYPRARNLLLALLLILILLNVFLG